MRLHFPSRDFTKNAAKVLNNRKALEIIIKKNGWRGRLLIKEIHFWPRTKDTSKIDGVLCKPPSAIFSWLMLRLSTIHYLALGANYELKILMESDSLIIRYVPM